MGVSIRHKQQWPTRRARFGREGTTQSYQEGIPTLSLLYAMVSFYSYLNYRAQPVANSPDLRPRSKTFEEYEKDTNDAWDDEAEDLSHLSSPVKPLEFNHTGSGEFDVKFSGKKGN